MSFSSASMYNIMRSIENDNLWRTLTLTWMHTGSDLDARTRAKLWQTGWDFNHGTGHGIGYFLNVHEGPGRISIGQDQHSPLYDGMFFSDGT